MMVQLPPDINQTRNQSKVLETHPEAYLYVFLYGIGINIIRKEKYNFRHTNHSFIRPMQLQLLLLPFFVEIVLSPNLEVFSAESLWARLKLKNRSKNGPSSCQLLHRLHYHSNLVVTVVWKPDISIVVCINEPNYCSRSWQIIFLNRVSALVQFSYLESISHAEPHIIENIHPNSVRSRA